MLQGPSMNPIWSRMHVARTAAKGVSRAVPLHLQTLGAEAGLVQQSFQKALDGRVAGGVVTDEQKKRTRRRRWEEEMNTG